MAQRPRIYAKRALDPRISRSEQLAAVPLWGRRVPEHARNDLREVQAVRYRLIYRVVGPDRLDVLAVGHGTRQLPDDIGDL